MTRTTLSTILLLILSYSYVIAQISDTLPEVSIKATRSSLKFMAPSTEVSILKQSPLNLGAEAPSLLLSVPSLSISSDAGNMIGYSQLNIRGSDAQRIQVAINGVPYNDAESHQVYWVNIPDLLSSALDIQVQRGVGYSMLGGTNLGGLISIKTTQRFATPQAQAGITFGSFNSLRLSTHATTGVMSGGWQIAARASHTRSDGYIDRASSELNSLYLSLSRFDPKWTQHLILFNGSERTYQAWYGVEYSRYLINRRYNIAGTDYEQKAGSPYPEQTDNYAQTHIQWIHNYYLTSNQQIGLTAYYVGGRGYYDEYLVNQNLNNYIPQWHGSSDLTRQLWLRNHLLGINLQHIMSYRNIENITAISAQKYIGHHFGQVTNVFDFPNLTANGAAEAYRSLSDKSEVTAFNKSAWTLNRTTLNLDLQVRKISYDALGTLLYGGIVDFDHQYFFFNPKVGAQYQWCSTQKSYFYAGIGQKEPNRQDFVDAPIGQLPKHEQLLDLEAGHEFRSNHTNASINALMMIYRNQLVNTGAINEVGAPIRSNIDHSYRAGFEIAASHSISPKWHINSHASYIVSKSVEHTSIVAAYNPDFSLNDSFTTRTTLRNTDLSYAPRFTGYAELNYFPNPNLRLMLQQRVVSSQYIDLTQSDNRMIPSYAFTNVAAELSLAPKGFKQIKLNLLINNLLNTLTYTHAYTFHTGRYVMSPTEVLPETHYVYVFPQAGIHAMLGLTFHW